MSTFSQIKTNISLDLNDAGVVHFTDSDLNTSVQSAYNDIIALSQCIVKKTTLNWQNNLTYYDFKALGVSDYLATVAIFDNVTKRWMQDDLLLYQFDKLRDNWETWQGAPNWWAFAAFNKTAIVPKKSIATGTYDLYYWATAPLISNGTTPLIPTDQQNLIEFFSVADQIESVDEFVKASGWWNQYYSNLEPFVDRMKSLAQADLRILI